MKQNIKLGVIAALMLIILTPVTSNAMHIMEGYLPVKWSIAWGVIFIPFFLFGLKSIGKIVKQDPKKKVLLALCGAFVFVLSALKIPSVTGSCSHPTGVGLGAIMFGPSVMFVLGTIVLIFQALLLAMPVFLAAAIGDLATYTITSIQLALAFPDPSGGVMASAIKFLGIFFMTQIPIAIAEGILTVIVYNLITENGEKSILENNDKGVKANEC